MSLEEARLAHTPMRKPEASKHGATLPKHFVGAKMGRTAILAVLGLVLVLASSLAVEAEHEPSHRYIVTGNVVLEDGSPACGVAIQAADRTATTDLGGRYRIQLHLHDSTVPGENDEGLLITVRVVGSTLAKTTTALPGPSDDGWGESEVDFAVPAELAKECVAPALLAGLYIGIPAAVVAGAALTYFRLVRPWWQSRPATPPLLSLSGIGKGRVREFHNVGIRTVDDLARAEPEDIAQRTSVGRKEAKRLVKRARDALSRRD